MVRKLITLIAKNFKLLLRSKTSALIILLGPLFLILLLSVAFNTANIYGIRVGVYAETYSPLAESLVAGIQKQQYTVTKTDSQDQCITSIKQGVYHLCVFFPRDLQPGHDDDIELHVDTSKTTLAYVLTDVLNKEIGAKSKEISTELAQNVVNTLAVADQGLRDKDQLLTTLTTDVPAIRERLDALKAKLLALDVSASDVSFGALEGSIVSVSNESTTQSALDRLKRDVDSLSQKLLTADSTKVSVIKDLAQLSALLASDLEYVRALRSSLQEIGQDLSDAQSTDPSRIASPLTTTIHPVTSGGTYLNYFFPTLIVMIIMFASIFLSSTLIIRERMSSVNFKNFITPTSDFLFTCAAFFTNLFVVFVQLAVLFGVALFFFTDQLVPVLGPVFLVLLLTSTVFVLLGILIGHVFKSEETSLLASLTLGVLFLFFSSAIFPIEALPPAIKMVASGNPFYLSQTLLNKLLLFHVPLSSLWFSLLFLAGYSAFLFLLIALSQKFFRTQE